MQFEYRSARHRFARFCSTNSNQAVSRSSRSCRRLWLRGQAIISACPDRVDVFRWAPQHRSRRVAVASPSRVSKHADTFRHLWFFPRRSGLMISQLIPPFSCLEQNISCEIKDVWISRREENWRGSKKSVFAAASGSPARRFEPVPS